MSAGPCAPNFEPGFDGLLAGPARNAGAGDDEGLHADVLRARLDRGVHDLGRDVVLRCPRTHDCEVDSRFRGNDGEEVAPREHGCEDRTQARRRAPAPRCEAWPLPEARRCLQGGSCTSPA